MPRFYFDIIDGGKANRDEFGEELADDNEARNQALELVVCIAREELPNGDQHEFRATVRNEAGAVVYEASLTLDGRWWPGRR